MPFLSLLSYEIAKAIYARQVTPAELVVCIRSPIADLFTAPKRKTISAIFVGARGKSHFSAADLTVLWLKRVERTARGGV
ncbi:hypothetical protein Y032_0779g2292 [Ancylostoma ceylanicum]|uniref:Uncharacterized protein n=1 Tax=Ancylostoma ceylanicum TaxID=53326 RepID=A0A016WE97_9BILA|nr:hypothetical protein Y032_0779g2292 [Ancylostoma ceylanicum]